MAQNNYGREPLKGRAEKVDVSRKSNVKFKITKYFTLWAVFIAAGIIINNIVYGWLASGSQIINPIFDFKKVHNYGASFNLLQGKTDELIIAGVLCLVILTGLIVFKSAKLSQQMVSAMSLLAGGITLNTIERIQHGYVTDYLQLQFAPDFPVFNAADMMIVIGAFMLVCSLLFKSKNYQ